MLLIWDQLVVKLYTPNRGFEMTVNATMPQGENSD